MLRISTIDKTDFTMIRLEGKLAHEWVTELRSTWSALPQERQAVSIIDLANVSYVDESGGSLLAEMHAAGATLTGSGPMIMALIEEVQGAPKNGSWLRKALLSLLCLVIGFAAPYLFSQTASAPAVLTLEQAVALAKANNRQVKMQQLDAGKADDEVAIARTRRLPSLSTDIYGSGLLAPISFEFEKGAFGTFPSTGPIPDKNTEVTAPRSFNLFATAQVKQPLSQLYRINLGVKVKELQKQISNEEVRKTEQEVVRDVRKTYYAILQLQESYTASQAAITSLKELQRVLDARLAEQAALPADGMELKASLARAQQQQLVIENNVASAKEQLNLLLGRDPDTSFEVAEVRDLQAAEANLGEARARAVALRPELREAELKSRAADYDRRIKKSERLPDVGAFVSYFSPFNVDVVPKNIAAAGIQVTWEPFDWGRRSKELNEKKRAVEQADLALQHTRDAVLMEVNDTFRKLRETHAQVDVARLDRDAARERLRVVQNQYQQQAVLLSDVLDSQRKVAEAQYREQEALVAFWNAKAEFAKAIGEEQ